MYLLDFRVILWGNIWKYLFIFSIVGQEKSPLSSAIYKECVLSKCEYQISYIGRMITTMTDDIGTVLVRDYNVLG